MKDQLDVRSHGFIGSSAERRITQEALHGLQRVYVLLRWWSRWVVFLFLSHSGQLIRTRYTIYLFSLGKSGFFPFIFFSPSFLFFFTSAELLHLCLSISVISIATIYNLFLLYEIMKRGKQWNKKFRENR